MVQMPLDVSLLVPCESSFQGNIVCRIAHRHVVPLIHAIFKKTSDSSLMSTSCKCLIRVHDSVPDEHSGAMNIDVWRLFRWSDGCWMDTATPWMDPVYDP